VRFSHKAGEEFDVDANQQQARQRQQERRQRAAETFERALTDPAFRQRFLENARPMVESPEAQRTTPQLPPEAQAKRRQLLEQVLDRAAGDPQFHQQLKTDPRQALWNAGFGPQLEQLRAELPQEEVRGFGTGWEGTVWGGTYPIFLYTGFTGW
jgi:hypothetical protein